MSVILIVSSIAMPIAIKKNIDENNYLKDPFDCNEIIEKIKNFEMNMTSVVYVQGEQGEWEEYQRIHGTENRIWIDFENVPDKLIDAFVAIEDERFYSHYGVDWKRTTKAVINKIFRMGGGVFGGSTITQQLIKNVTGDNGRNSKRKIREICRALIIDKKMSKDDILEAYLNTISLGNGICGVQVAANYYFNKDVVELTLTECATLAAITKNPSKYNPVKSPEANKERRNTVLKKMFELGMITEPDYIEAINSDILLDFSQKENFEIPVNNYFIDTLIDNIIDDLSVKYNCSTSLASTMLYNGGFKIYSTLDRRIQEIMENVYTDVDKYFSQKAKKKDTKGKNVQSAMTIMDYQGHIVGIVGGVGEKKDNRGLNRAVNSPRQPGSTMKPLGAYAPALEAGMITPMQYYIDSPIDNYRDGKKGPKEWYGYYAGKMTVSSALERSANTIPVKIVKEMGVEKSFDFLTKKLHLKYLGEDDKNLSSLALGGCIRGMTTTESAASYAIFGNKGKYFSPKTYYKIERPNGETILTADTVGEQVIKPGTATLMNEMLQNVVYGSRGTGRRISSYSKMKAYAKTGTSSECNDLWMVAGTPYYVGSVWYGFDLQEEIYNSNNAANVWKAVMSEVHKDLEIKEFELSDETETKKYCAVTGKLAGKDCKRTKDGNFAKGINYLVCDGNHKFDYGNTSYGSSSALSSDVDSSVSGSSSSDATASNSTSSAQNSVSSGSNSSGAVESQDKPLNSSESDTHSTNESGNSGSVPDGNSPNNSSQNSKPTESGSSSGKPDAQSSNSGTDAKPDKKQVNGRKNLLQIEYKNNPYSKSQNSSLIEILLNRLFAVSTNNSFAGTYHR